MVVNEMKTMIVLFLAVMITFGVCDAETAFIPDGAEVIVIFTQQDMDQQDKREMGMEKTYTLRCRLFLTL